jgi:hypothetical protein
MLTVTDKAFTKRYFNECWREDANAIGADELNFHDNRGTAATLLAEAGATAPEIAEAMTWTVDKAQKVTCTLRGAACQRRTQSRSLRTIGTRPLSLARLRRIMKEAAN